MHRRHPDAVGRWKTQLASIIVLLRQFQPPRCQPRRPVEMMPGRFDRRRMMIGCRRFWCFGAIQMLRGFLFLDIGAAWFSGDRFYDPNWGGLYLPVQDPANPNNWVLVPLEFDLYDSGNGIGWGTAALPTASASPGTWAPSS